MHAVTAPVNAVWRDGGRGGGHAGDGGAGGGQAGGRGEAVGGQPGGEVEGGGGGWGSWGAYALTASWGRVVIGEEVGLPVQGGVGGEGVGQEGGEGVAGGGGRGRVRAEQGDSLRFISRMMTERGRERRVSNTCPSPCDN